MHIGSRMYLQHKEVTYTNSWIQLLMQTLQFQEARPNHNETQLRNIHEYIGMHGVLDKIDTVCIVE